MYVCGGGEVKRKGGGYVGGGKKKKKIEGIYNGNKGRRRKMGKEGILGVVKKINK